MNCHIFSVGDAPTGEVAGEEKSVAVVHPSSEETKTTAQGGQSPPPQPLACLDANGEI